MSSFIYFNSREASAETEYSAEVIKNALLKAETKSSAKADSLVKDIKQPVALNEALVFFTDKLGAIKQLSQSIIEVNEGRVKQFETDYADMEKSIKRGIGWIDPEYVADTWENSSDSIDFELVKTELYKRLIAAGLLAFSNPEDGETKGVPVRSLKDLSIKDLSESKEVQIYEGATEQMADEENFELYTATLKNKTATVTATTTTKTWPDGIPVLKYLARGKSASTQINIGGSFDVAHDVAHGWFYFTDGRKWFALHREDGYNEPSDLPFEMTIKESAITEGFEVHYSDGIRAFKKFNNEKQALAFARDLIKNKSGLQFVDVFKAGSGFHSTAETDAIVAFWGDGSYTDNVSKSDAKLATKKINESRVNEAYDVELFWKGLSGEDKKIGRFLVSKKDYEALENDFGGEVEFDLYDDKASGKIVKFNDVVAAMKNTKYGKTAMKESVNEALFKAKDFNKTLIVYKVDQKAKEIYVVDVNKLLFAKKDPNSTEAPERFSGMFGMMLEDDWSKIFGDLPEIGDILPYKNERALESVITEGVMSEIDIIAKEAKNFKEFVKEFKSDDRYKGLDTAGDVEEFEAWLKSIYDAAKEDLDESVITEAKGSALQDYVEAASQKTFKGGGNGQNLLDEAMGLAGHIDSYALGRDTRGYEEDGFYGPLTITAFKKLVDQMSADDIKNNQADKYESVVTEGKSAGLSKEETLKVAQKFADALAKVDGVKVTVSKGHEEDSFDLDYDGEEFAGGSYNIYKNGDVVNMAVPNYAVYGKMDDDIKTIIKNINKVSNESVITEGKSINKIQKEWSETTTAMSQKVEQWKSAEGDRKIELLDELKALTAKKRALESELDAAVAGKDKDLELVVSEGNAFGAARAEAIAKGEKEFTVDGETYPVESVDDEDKTNAEEFVKESKNDLWSYLIEKYTINEDLRTDIKKYIKSNKKEIDAMADQDNWEGIYSMLMKDFEVREDDVKMADEIKTIFNIVY